MKTFVFLALLFLAACGDGEDLSGPERGGERIELRPAWKVGERYEVREERVHHRGLGPFPAAGEIVSRSLETRREVHVYDDEVLAVADRTPTRIRRTYKTSEKAGKPTPVQGKTYEIEDLFGECRVKFPGPDGTEAPEEEAAQVRLSALRMAGSLLPGEPVAEGSNWRPARDFESLSIPGRKAISTRPSLRSVRETGGTRVATVECVTDIQILDGPLEGSRMTLTETVRTDLAKERLQGYRAVVEFHAQARPGRPEEWRRQEANMTLRAR